MRFKVHRRLVAEGAVEPHPVVKDFNPLEDGGKAIAQIIKNLPANPNAPASYPNVRKRLSGS